MTAVNVIVQSRAVHILSDGAAIDGAGRVQAICSKVVPLAHLNAVIGCRGPTTAKMAFAPIVDTAKVTSFDDLRAIFVDLVRQFCTFAAQRQALAQAPFGAAVDFVLAGIGSGGPAAVLAATHDAYGEPLKPHEARQSIGPVHDTKVQELRKLWPRDKPDEFDPRVHGLRLLEMQRAYPPTFGVSITPGLSPVFDVGGFAELTTITADGIHQLILKRWPDKIGEPIKP